jgi:hypothetical protein
MKFTPKRLNLEGLNSFTEHGQVVQHREISKQSDFAKHG